MKTVLTNRPFAPATDNHPQPDSGRTLFYTAHPQKVKVKTRLDVRFETVVLWDAFIQADSGKRVPIEQAVSLGAIQQKAKDSGRNLVFVPA